MHLVWHVVSSVQYLNQSPSKVKIPSQLKKWQSHYILKLLFLNWLHVSLFMFWIAKKSRCKSELDLTQPSNYICSLVATIWIIVESNLTWQTLLEVIHTRDQTLSSQSNAGVTSWDLWGSTDNNNTLCTPSCHMDVVDRTILSKFWHKVSQNLPRTSLNEGQISREWHCTREHQAVKLNKHWYIKTHHCSS